MPSRAEGLVLLWKESGDFEIRWGAARSIAERDFPSDSSTYLSVVEQGDGSCVSLSVAVGIRKVSPLGE